VLFLSATRTFAAIHLHNHISTTYTKIPSTYVQHGFQRTLSSRPNQGSECTESIRSNHAYALLPIRTLAHANYFTLTPHPTDNLELLDFPYIEDCYIVGGWHGDGEDRYWETYLVRPVPSLRQRRLKDYTSEGKTLEDAYSVMLENTAVDLDLLYTDGFVDLSCEFLVLMLIGFGDSC
jgi:hypothetical protein